MLEQIKRIVRKQLYNKCYREYEQQTERQKNRYGEFLRQRGEKPILQPAEGAFQPMVHGWQRIQGKNLILFHRKNGMLSAEALSFMERIFEEEPGLRLVYAHEDCIRADGERHSPWIKPCWSPDTLESSWYFGSMLAVSASACREADQENPVSLADSLTAEYWKQPGAVRLVDHIFFHRYAEAELPAEEEIERYEMPLLKNALIQGSAPADSLISIIIPSRDNPGVLETCIGSIRNETAGVNYEIVVVDNGSNEENRSCLLQLSKVYGFQYLYEPMEFNFSTMCNLGAARAKGSFFLFLNDDMEILEPDWLQKMLEKAVQEHVGAVGAKLLYPGTDLIQHAGVTNLRVGPAHKLLKNHDSRIYYHGRNRYVHDMLAVTAACLLVAAEKYRQAGGFYEGMKVAYNDVDFCFGLYEAGYYNVQRNDVVLYHHESLSRGDDNLSEEKWKRLLQEKAILYERHPGLWNRDPFYSPLLAEHFSDYLCNYEYEYEKRDWYTAVKKYRAGEPLKWENNCLVVNAEHGEPEKKLDLTEEQEVYWLEGWAYVLGTETAPTDNCRYRREVLLVREDGIIYQAQCLNRYRKDVADILPQQTNVELAGFVCRIPKGKLPAGKYRLGLLAKDRCSGQKLYRKTDLVFMVEQL